jgi:hypothetical protein
VNNQAVGEHFDLSRNKSLRTLETTSESITVAGDAASGFLKKVLATVAPALPLDVVIAYGNRGVGYSVTDRPRGVLPCRGTGKDNALRHAGQFRVFNEMYKVREFRLILCADVHDWIVERAVGVLERIVETEKKNGRLDYLPCGPFIISEVRSLCTSRGRNPVGAVEGEWHIEGSAL